MVAKFYQVTPGQLASFLRNPTTAYDYILAPSYSDPAALEWTESVLAEMRIKSQGLPAGVSAQVDGVAGQFARKSQAAKGPQLVKHHPEPERQTFSLEKDWHVLHYALNGTQEGGIGPLASAILGGQEIPDVEGINSFGAASSVPLRYLTVAEVQSISAALLEVDASLLLSKLDFEDALQKKIYLGHTLDDLANWQYLPDLFSSFRSFYAQAAGSRNCMLLSIV